MTRIEQRYLSRGFVVLDRRYRASKNRTKSAVYLKLGRFGLYWKRG